VIEKGLATLNNLARDMGKEIDKQTNLIEMNTRSVEKTNVSLSTMNMRMRHAVTSVRTCDKFVLDFILIIVILAIAGYIYNMIS
jgi:t-SNARE complex subunit (syntaxin)